MKRNKRNEVILFCVAALICGAVIAICISVSMKNNSSESGSSTGEASQTSEMTSVTPSVRKATAMIPATRTKTWETMLCWLVHMVSRT